MDQITAYLRTLRGQLALFGLTTLGALTFAMFLASQTAFFQSFVRESQFSIDPATIKQIDSHLEKLMGKETISLTEDQRERVYRMWLFGTDEMQPDSSSLQRFASIAPGWFDKRIERTLVAGNLAQRKRAVEYAVKSKRDGMKNRLKWGLDHANRLGPPGAAKIIEEGLKLLP